MTPLPGEIKISIKNEKVFGNRKSSSYRTGLMIFVAFTVLIAFLSGTALTASSQVVFRLPGSDFEIDSNANLTVDDDPAPSGRPSIDWTVVDDQKMDDNPSGSGDNSFTQGTKEDTQTPTVDFGSIPPNKSDLKTFGIYEETNEGGKFLHLFWTRVQDPSGTTNMDFEFTKNKCDPYDPAGSVCTDNGVTPVRTAGDLLIVYELSRGGTVPQLFSFRWYDATNAPTGTPSVDCEAKKSYPCWGGRTNLTESARATGSINSSFIPAADSDGLGDLDPRTFGEASINLSFVFDPNKCESYGSTYLKSRSSDSFTSSMKDFIAPITTTISNCGTVIIRKQTDPDGLPGTFVYTTNLATHPTSPTTFSLSDNGVEMYEDIVLAGNGYTVIEEDPTTIGFDLTDIDCTEESWDLITYVDVYNRSVTFDMTVGGIVDCTFTNTGRGNIIIDKVTNPSGDSQEFDFSLTGGPDAISQSFVLADTTTPYDSGPVKPGTYNVTETVPAGWNLTSAICDDGSNPSAIDLDVGEKVTCTFTNSTGAIKIIKTKKDKSSGPGEQPHEGVTFNVSLNGQPIATVVTETDGTACVDGLEPGQTYTVTEIVPPGYEAESSNPKYVTVSSEGASCSSGTPDVATFSNTPLSKLEFTFYSLAGVGVTTATIQCQGIDGTSIDLEDGVSRVLTDLPPDTYTCTIVIDP